MVRVWRVTDFQEAETIADRKPQFFVCRHREQLIPNQLIWEVGRDRFARLAEKPARVEANVLILDPDPSRISLLHGLDAHCDFRALAAAAKPVTLREMTVIGISLPPSVSICAQVDILRAISSVG